MNELNTVMENEVMSTVGGHMGLGTAGGFAMGAGSTVGVLAAIWGIRKFINYKKTKKEDKAQVVEVVDERK